MFRLILVKLADILRRHPVIALLLVVFCWLYCPSLLSEENRLLLKSKSDAIGNAARVHAERAYQAFSATYNEQYVEPPLSERQYAELERAAQTEVLVQLGESMEKLSGQVSELPEKMAKKTSEAILKSQTPGSSDRKESTPQALHQVPKEPDRVTKTIPKAEIASDPKIVANSQSVKSTTISQMPHYVVYQRARASKCVPKCRCHRHLR